MLTWFLNHRSINPFSYYAEGFADLAISNIQNGETKREQGYIFALTFIVFIIAFYFYTNGYYLMTTIIGVIYCVMFMGCYFKIMNNRLNKEEQQIENELHKLEESDNSEE